MSNNNHKDNKGGKGLSVEVRNNNVEQALRRLKKMIAKDGIMQTLRDRKHFVTNTEKRLKAQSAAAARHRRRISDSKYD